MEGITVVGIDVRHLGGYIREQRNASDISLRQLARLAGVNNGYLSQIERSLRKPSGEVLQQIAKALHISAEALYVQAGILEQREGSGAVPDAVLGDEGLNERQKQVLLDIYDSFCKGRGPAGPADADVAVTVVTATTLADDLAAADPSHDSARQGRRQAPRAPHLRPEARHPARPHSPPADM